jgi:RIO kinase 1
VSLYAAGADVPRPAALAGNGVLMEFIGVEQEAAPRLHEVELERHEARQLFDRLMGNLEIWLRCHRIHGDLSPYNILVHENRLIVIDFAQAVDPRYASDVSALLERDVERICAYFSRYQIQAQPRRLADDLWSRYVIGQI